MSLPLLNAKKQYLDQNGNPLAGGSVAYYIPGTTTPVNTYQDQGLSILNSNPVVLDANGQTIAWIGDSTTVREIVKDFFGNLIWDQVTTVGVSQGQFLMASSFGVTGDGVSNTTTSLAAADAAAFLQNRKLYIGEGTFVVTSLAVKSAWVGEGRSKTTILRHPSAPTGPMLTAAGSSFELSEMTLDGNKANNSNGCHNVYLSSSVTHVGLTNVRAQNAKLNAGWGSGLFIEGGSEGGTSIIEGCELQNNDQDGITLTNSTNMSFIGNTCIGNTGNGASFNNFDQTFTQKLNVIRVIGNHFSTNGGAGFGLANFVANNNFTVPVYGIANPEANQCIVSNNTAVSNGSYGIALSGYAISATGNVCYANSTSSATSAGILFTATYSSLNANVVYSNLGGFGIDAGGSQCVNIQNNSLIFNSGVGLNLEGNAYVQATGNFFYHNSTDTNGQQLSISRYGAGSVTNGFPQTGVAINVDANFFLIDNTRIPIYVHDNPDYVSITNNKFFSAVPTTDIFRCVYAIGSSVKMSGNRMLNTSATALTPTAGGQLQVPDILELANTNSTQTIGDLRTSSMILVDTGIAYCTVGAGGSGYTSPPAISFSGGGGSGATANAIISASGNLTGIAMTAFGSGYTSAPTVVISGGGGSGASATAQWKLPVPEGRELTLLCQQAETITRAGVVTVENPGVANISVPQFGCVGLVGLNSQWYLKTKNF